MNESGTCRDVDKNEQSTVQYNAKHTQNSVVVKHKLCSKNTDAEQTSIPSTFSVRSENHSF